MKKSIIVPVSVVAAGFLIGILLFITLAPSLVSKLFAEEQIGAGKPPIVPNEHVRAINKAFEDVSNAVNPIVVSISVTIENKKATNPYHDEFREFFKYFGEPFDENPGPTEGGGSGVLISGNGYIVTNNHVVENASEIKVKTFEKKEYKAKLIGRDPLTDLAVIKIEGSGFPFVHFANIEDVKVGEMVLAVGNPLGLNSTVTAGIISAIGRGGLSLMSQKSGYAVENFIQTDAAINPGNSGGGLFNLEGSLVGINSAIATRTGTYIGYGFAIPVDLVKAVALDLIDNGKISRGYIGVKISTIDDVMAKSVGLDKVEGVVVNDVIKDSPALKSGVEVGDIILEIDGKPLKTSNELQGHIVKKRSGDKVDLTIWRDGKKFHKSVKLEPRSDDGSDTASDDAQKGDEGDEDIGKPFEFDNLGFSISPLNSQQKEEIEAVNGVYIASVKRGSIAAKRGLMPNGVIVKADKERISAVKDLKRIVTGKKSGEALRLQVKYKDTSVMVALEIP